MNSDLKNMYSSYVPVVIEQPSRGERSFDIFLV